MLQIYSKSQTLLTGAILPFNSVSLSKGKTAVLNGVNSIELNDVDSDGGDIKTYRYATRV